MRNIIIVIARRRSQRSNPYNSARRNILWIAASAVGFLAMTVVNAGAEPMIQPECVVIQKAEVGADYVPGVDVEGRPVAPADLNATAVSAVPDPMIVPVTIDIAKRVGLSVQGLEMSGNTGFLEVYRDGRVFYNGQDLTQKVKAICGYAPEAPAPTLSFDPDRQTVTKDIEYAPDDKPMPAAPVSTPSGQ